MLMAARAASISKPRTTICTSRTGNFLRCATREKQFGRYRMRLRFGAAENPAKLAEVGVPGWSISLSRDNAQVLFRRLRITEVIVLFFLTKEVRVGRNRPALREIEWPRWPGRWICD